MASRKASGIANLRPLAGKGPGATSRLGLMASKRTYAAQMPVRNICVQWTRVEVQLARGSACPHMVRFLFEWVIGPIFALKNTMLYCVWMSSLHSIIPVCSLLPALLAKQS